MSKIRERVQFYIGRIKAGRLKSMWLQLKWISGYGRKYLWHMLFYTLLGMGNTVVSLAIGFVSKDLVDIITGHQTGEVLKYFIMMVVYNVVSMSLNQLIGYLSNYISMKVDSEIKSDIFSKILVTDWESLTNYHTGDLLTRWSSDASNISSGVLNFIPNTVVNIFRLISAFAVIIYYDPSFAIFAFLGIPVSLLLSRTLMNRMIRNNERSAAMSAKMSGFNQEAFSNVQTIKAFDLIKLYVARLKQIQKEYISMRLEFQRMAIWTSILFSTVGMLVSYSSYGWGIYRVWSGAISYGTMTMFLTLTASLTAAVNNVTSIVPSVISLTTSAGRLMDIVEMPREDYSNEEEASQFMEKYRNTGISVKIDNMVYKYKSGVENVFENADFEANPHKIVAIVGPSGEGKTTLLRILLSLVNLGGGEAVLFPGSDIGKAVEKLKMDPSSRKMFSYVPQGNSLFSGTIAENMRSVKPDATDEEIIEALKISCAWDFVNKMPDGINSLVKERGGGFSEGQAQRIAIARSIIRKSPILLLDEATSALDVETERELLRNIMKDEYPRTCIVTTHRPTVLSMCDKVYGIREKKCVELTGAEIKKIIENF